MLYRRDTFEGSANVRDKTFPWVLPDYAQTPKFTQRSFDMLVFAQSGLGDMEIDKTLIAAQAARLGRDTATLWQALLARASHRNQTDDGVLNA